MTQYCNFLLFSCCLIVGATATRFGNFHIKQFHVLTIMSTQLSHLTHPFSPPYLSTIFDFLHLSRTLIKDCLKITCLSLHPTQFSWKNLASTVRNYFYWPTLHFFGNLSGPYTNFSCNLVLHTVALTNPHHEFVFLIR